jgi:hypothetical protein
VPCVVDAIGVTVLVVAVVMVAVGRFRSYKKKLNKEKTEKNPGGTNHCRCACSSSLLLFLTLLLWLLLLFRNGCKTCGCHRVAEGNGVVVVVVTIHSVELRRALDEAGSPDVLSMGVPGSTAVQT